MVTMAEVSLKNCCRLQVVLGFALCLSLALVSVKLNTTIRTLFSSYFLSGDTRRGQHHGARGNRTCATLTAPALANTVATATATRSTTHALEDSNTIATMNGQQQQQRQRQRHHHQNRPEARARRGNASEVPSRPPSHFFSHGYKKVSPAELASPYVFYVHPHQNITGAPRNWQQELMQMRGDYRFGIPPMLGDIIQQHLPPLPPHGAMIVGGVAPNQDGNTIDDTTTLRAESIDHIIALQEERARRDYELEQLRQLEFIQAVNVQRTIFEEEMMLAEQHHYLSNRQSYCPPLIHGQGAKEASSNGMKVKGDEDEELRNRQSRLTQLQSMSTEELLARVHSKLSEEAVSRFQRQERYQYQERVSSGSGEAMKPTHSAHHAAEGEGFAAVVDNFSQPPRYYMPPSRSNTGGRTTAPPRHPSLRYWNNGVEVDIRGVPLTSRLHSSNSATPAATTRTSATTSSSSHPNSNDSINIFSQFSKLVMSCVPELNTAISNLLSELMHVKGFPSDPLIVHSKFPVHVGSVLVELKSLGERSTDKVELFERITNCVAAIEPYKNKNELGESSSVHAQIRAIVEEGTGRASTLISHDPSEIRAKRKRKKKEKELKKKRKRSDGKEYNMKSSCTEFSQCRKELIGTDILGMYQDHKDKEEFKANDSLSVTSASPAEESADTCLPLKSDDDAGSSNAKEVEMKKISNSSSSDITTTEPKVDNDTSQPPAKKHRIFVGPHSNLLRQIFGNGNRGRDSADNNFSSTDANAVGIATPKQASSDQKQNNRQMRTLPNLVNYL